MNQNQGSQENKSSEFKMMNPKVFRKGDPFFAFHKKQKADTRYQLEHSQVHISQQRGNQSQEHNNVSSEDRKLVKEKIRQSHSKKNPIAPIKQSIKMLDQFGKNINEDYSSFVQFAKSVSQHRQRENKQPEIKLDECLTLKIVKKLDNGGCMKKVLNVPTFKIFLLEQRPINNNDARQTVLKDLEKWNTCPVNSYQIKNVKLYWNTPEQFASLLHQYVPNYSLESVLTHTINLPEQALAEKMVNIIHMASLFEKEGIKLPKLSTQELLISLKDGVVRIKPSITLGMQQTKMQNSMTHQVIKWIEPDNQKMRLPLKIGLLALYLSLGKFIMQEEIGEKIFDLYDGESNKNQNKLGCCLLHRLDHFKQQLIMYSLNRQKWSHNLEDFLCKCLSFDRKKRMNLQQIKNHSFITRVEQIQRVSFLDLLDMVKKQNQPPNTTQIQIGYRLQLNKVADAIKGILSNNSIKHRVELPINAENPSLKFLEQEIGLDKGILMEKLNRAYADFK